LAKDVDVCQADHHGSHTSSAEDFMRDLEPEVIIISNGSTKKYFSRFVGGWAVSAVMIDTWRCEPSTPH
jgi:hypothetical protein